jgi:uncharacterized Zn-finger protein
VPTKKEKQPLSVTHPDLAKEADGWDPTQITSGSNRRVTWKCSKEHIFYQVIKERSSGNSGCPYCANRLLLTGFNDLLTLHPQIAKEAYEWDPEKVKPSDSQHRKWICSNNHVWEGKPVERLRGRATCPYCRGRKSIPGETDLGTSHPAIALQADGWNPSDYRPGSRAKMKWICSSGHRWEAIISSRVTGKSCPYCSGRLPIQGETDLLTKFPLIAASADGWDPSKVHHGSVSKKKWKCKFGHSWTTGVNHRTRHETNCPVCGNDIPLAGFNDIQTTHPEIAKEASGWDPTTVVAGSHKKRMWRCQKNHEYEAPIHQRALGNSGCPYCSGQKTLTGFNDVETLFPAVALEADGWNPKEFVASSHKVVSWKCNLGHRWNARIFSRVKNGLGCPICAGKQVLVGFNDLATTHPEIASQANGWDPTTVSKGHSTKVSWICSSEHIWSARPSTRTSGFGCPSCAASGFDPNDDGYLYFIHHPNWIMYQIGITNKPEIRLKDHNRLGWDLLELRGPMDGHLTQQWETAILRMLKAKGADLSNAKIAGRFDGYSEAWSKSTFEAKSIKELMRLTEEFEG